MSIEVVVVQGPLKWKRTNNPQVNTGADAVCEKTIGICALSPDERHITYHIMQLCEFLIRCASSTCELRGESSGDCAVR